MEEGSREFGSAVVLIPAYNPDDRLLALLRDLKPRVGRIVLVDDGSTSGRDVLARAGEFVETTLRHPANRGKGAALKTGLGYIGACDVVTADADGQHTPDDIVRVAAALRTHRGGLVLGVRSFVGKVPLRSRFGNFCTRWMFFLMTRMLVGDTQTGLRGIPGPLVERLLKIPGDRYEYEMAVLADSRHHPSRPLEVPIRTVYLEANRGSHFQPIRDALRIYGTLLQFCVSSVLGFLLDNAVFALMAGLLASAGYARETYALLALVVARVVSAHFNYLYNRLVVFRRRDYRAPRGRSYFAYMGLVVAIGASSYALTLALSCFLDVRGVTMTAVKVVVDTCLFLASYWVQKRFVFAAKARK